MTAPAVPRKAWVWCGLPGHFIGAHSCLFHLHTRVGDYRISTVGEYLPRGITAPAHEVGYHRLYETAVFHVDGYGTHGEGEVTDWQGVEMVGSNDPVQAETNHLAACRKYARRS